MKKPKPKKKRSRARRAKDAPALRAYVYGLPLGPIEGAEAIEEQFRRAHRYKNDLIAIERARRESYRAIMSEDPSIAAIDAQIAGMVAELEELRAAAKAASAEARKRVRMAPDARIRVAELKEGIKRLRVERKAACKSIEDPRVAVNEARANDMVKRFRKACGLRPSGTYVDIEAAVKRAADDAAKNGGLPKFRKWHRVTKGSIVVQLTATKASREAGIYGLPVAALFDGSDRRIQIDRTPQVRKTKRHPEGVEIPNSAMLRMRIGGEVAAFPVILHQPLPADGVIKWARVKRTRVGARWRWELLLTVESPSFVMKPRAGQAVAIVYCAKGERAGRRVAFALGADGQAEAFELPPTVTGSVEHPLEPFGGVARRADRMKLGTHEALAKADDMRAKRDRYFNAARETLLAWLDANEAPEWLVEATRYLPQLKSTRRFVELVRRWQRFEGDEEIFATLDAWRRRDRHLYDYETGLRSKALGRRRELARRWAAKLARQYEHYVDDNTDLSSGLRNANPEDEVASGDHTHRTSIEAAPGEARAAVRHAFDGRHTMLPRRTNCVTTCPVCEGKALAGNYSVVCTACGADLDADFARAWWLLRDAGYDTSAVERTWRETVAAVRELKEMH